MSQQGPQPEPSPEPDPSARPPPRTYDLNDLPSAVRDNIEEAIQAFEERGRPRIAVIGRTGVGKSSFINSLRGLTPDDEGAAHVSESGEGTTEPAVYQYFGIDFEDVPGGDGATQTLRLGSEYIQRFKLDTADVVLILWERTIDDTLADCASCLANTHCRPVFLVHTKLDNLARQYRGRRGQESMSDDQVVNRVRESTLADLRRHGLENLISGQSNRLFYISTELSERDRFDAPRLRQEIPTSIRDEAIASRFRGMFMGNLEDFIANCAGQCMGVVPTYVLAASAAGAIPIFVWGADLVVIATRATWNFLQVFGLVPGSFSSSGWATLARYLAEAIVTKLGLMMAAVVAVDGVADATLFIPVAGLFVHAVGGAAICGYGMRRLLHKVIRKLEGCARVMYGQAVAGAMRELAGDGLERIQNMIDEAIGGGE